MAVVTPDEYLHPKDVRNSYVLTRTLEKKKPETELYDVPFCPLRSFNGRKVKLNIRIAYAAGLAGFKADNANTPIVTGQGDLQEQYIELATIAEKEVLNASDLIMFNSPDDTVAWGAARSVVDKATVLRIRNVNRTRWMAWQAVKDELTITYPSGAAITIDYDLDGDAQNDDFSGSHLPTAAVAWNAVDGDGNYTTDIIEDMFTWTKLIADDHGVDQADCIMHISTGTWRVIRKNEKIKAELSRFQPRILIATRQEVITILEIADIKIVNDHYWDSSNKKQKFLPDGYALITAPYTYDGTPLMEMYDGLVARVVNNQVVVATNPGMVAETYINAEQVAENVRVQTARMPIMNHPAGIVYAKLW